MMHNILQILIGRNLCKYCGEDGVDYDTCLSKKQSSLRLAKCRLIINL